MDHLFFLGFFDHYSGSMPSGVWEFFRLLRALLGGVNGTSDANEGGVIVVGGSGTAFGGRSARGVDDLVASGASTGSTEAGVTGDAGTFGEETFLEGLASTCSINAFFKAD